MKQILKILVDLYLLNFVLAKETNRALEGYPVGLISDCPGSTKESIISKNSLRKLSMFHLNGESFLGANRTQYNYHQMKKLAKRLDFKKKTILYMNGYLDSSNLIFVTPAMGSLYTDLGYNVLLLEYVEFSAKIYPQAARLLRAVGRRTAEMLSVLTSEGLNPKTLELLGVSLGGQGISFIAKNYRRITGYNISRVTSLDPAGPCFRRLGPEERIDASDADFVDIIHTNNEGYGFAGPVGHVDFYINGGEFQNFMLIELPCSSLCSHMQSYLMWVAAMNHPNSLIGMQCKSVQDARDKNCFDKPMITNVIGLNTDRSKTGIFYVPVTNRYPFFMGKRGLKKGNDVFTKYMESFNAEEVMVV